MEDKEVEDIVKKNVSKLHSYVRGRVSNRDEAEDIVQDTIYQFLRTIRVLDNPILHVSGWLYTVAHNLIINHSKKHREESLITTTHVEGDENFMYDLSEIMKSDDRDNPDTQILRSMVWEELGKALSELPEEQRQAIEMTEIEGLSVKEASQKMGVSQNTFLSRKHYAVKHIRERLYHLYVELTRN